MSDFPASTYGSDFAIKYFKYLRNKIISYRKIFQISKYWKQCKQIYLSN